VSVQDLGNLVVLIGPNSSGKTNLLDAIHRFFAEIDSTGPIQKADRYMWFDCDQGNIIEVSVSLRLDDETCERLLPRELLDIMRKKFKDRCNELTIHRVIESPAAGWRTKSIKWADVELVRDGRQLNVKDLARTLNLEYISYDDLMAVFFDPRASKTNITGDRLIIVKPLKKAYYMGSYADQLVRSGKVKFVNVSDKTRDWRGYVAQQGYELVEKQFSEDVLKPKARWLTPDFITKMISGILNGLKGRFKVIPAARNLRSKAAFERIPFIDQETQSSLREMSVSDDRGKQRRWSVIKRYFDDITGSSLEPHPSYVRIDEGDLPLPLELRGGGDQELLALLYHLTDDDSILAIEEPELHLHPRLARKVFQLIKETSARRQIFITTHSTIFVDSAELEHTWIVRKEDKETKVYRVGGIEDLKMLLLDLGVKPSDIFMSEAIIFVEGPSDKVVFTQWGDKMGVDLRSPKISIIQTKGKSRGKYYIEVFHEACQAANVQYFWILDKDAEKDEEVRKFVRKGILIPNENLFILSRGSIEDYYPLERLKDAIQEEFGIKLSEDEVEKLKKAPRAKQIESILRERKLDIRGWKVRIGKRVARSMEFNEIDKEIVSVLERIRTGLESR